MNRYAVGVVLAAGLAVARIAATYGTFTGTYDEPFHVANGMEWLQRGTYTYQQQHPPLAEIAVALGPFARGARAPEVAGLRDESASFAAGAEILHAGARYWLNLTLARLGTLPFLLLAMASTFLWARRYFSGEAAFWAVLMLASLPPLLGHAGLATNDVACAALAVTALYAYMRWLEEPGIRRCVGWGAITGLALVCKFSNAVFLPVCYGIGLLYAAGVHRQMLRANVRGRWMQAGIAAGVAFLAMWAVYRFTLAPLGEIYGAHPRVDRILADHSFLRSLWNAGMTVPLPLTEMMIGLRDVYRHNVLGHDSFLLGEWRQTGWWYFFPVVLAVKTPIGFLVLAGAGATAVLRRLAWAKAVTIVFALGILMVAMTSRIDLGVRHILPLYPLLAILAGHAVAEAFRKSKRWAIAAGMLCAWVVADSWLAHPDYLAWFNPLAGRNPEKVLAESDLDWGQDLDRLSRRLKEKGIDRVAVAYFGSAQLDKSGLPPYTPLLPDQPVRGWAAVSLHYLTIEYSKNGSYGRLKAHTPVERIGKSIDLFFIP